MGSNCCGQRYAPKTKSTEPYSSPIKNGTNQIYENESQQYAEIEDSNFEKSLEKGEKLSLLKSDKKSSKHSEPPKLSGHQNLQRKNFRDFRNVDNIKEEYDFKRKLGSGAYGTVFEAIHRLSGERRAIKVIRKQPNSLRDWHKMMDSEIKMLHLLNHPNFVLVHDLMQDAQHIFVVAELIENGDLMNVVQKRAQDGLAISEGEVAEWIHQILCALNYLHEQGVMHRDLKLENVMVDQHGGEMICKITDFGFAARVSAEKESFMVGTPIYMAPEILQKRHYDNKVDVWALGVMACELLFAHTPFTGTSREQLFRKIKQEQPDLIGGPKRMLNQGREARNFIKRCLEKDPAKRPFPDELLHDPWLVAMIDQDDEDDLTDSDEEKGQKRAKFDEETARDILDFVNISKFQASVVTFLINLKANKSTLNTLGVIFRSLDKDNSGMLSKEEIFEGIEAAKLDLVQILGDQEIDREELFDRMDTDGDGMIDFDEFVQAAYSKNELINDRNLEIAFKSIDKDGDGQLTVDELLDDQFPLEKLYHPFGLYVRSLLKNFQFCTFNRSIRKVFSNGVIESLTESNQIVLEENYWQEQIELVDKNGDGKMQFSEFKQMMSSILVKKHSEASENTELQTQSSEFQTPQKANTFRSSQMQKQGVFTPISIQSFQFKSNIASFFNKNFQEKIFTPKEADNLMTSEMTKKTPSSGPQTPLFKRGRVMSQASSSQISLNSFTGVEHVTLSDNTEIGGLRWAEIREKRQDKAWKNWFVKSLQSQEEKKIYTALVKWQRGRQETNQE